MNVRIRGNRLKKVYSEVVQFRGNHYDFGYMQGQMLKGSQLFENLTKQRRGRKQRFYVEADELKFALLPLAPGIWEELIGLRDGLEWSLERVVNFFGGYLREIEESGCSVYTGKDYFVRNYDFHPQTYEGRLVLFQPTNNNYSTIGPSQHITGRMDGMNEKGLTIAYNFVNRKQPEPGFIPNMINRMILETCADTSEAISFLRQIPHLQSFNFVLLDDQGVAHVVEASPRGVKVRQANICTNHFEMMTEENRYHLADSIRRENAILHEEQFVHNAYDAYRMFNDRNKGVFSEKYANSAGTIHTSAYFPQQKMMWFALGGDRQPLQIEFNQWVNGQDIRIKRINGMINTKEPFLHMDPL